MVFSRAGRDKDKNEKQGSSDGACSTVFTS